MKYQTKGRNWAGGHTQSQAQSCLAWAPQLFQKSFLHTSHFPYFSMSLAILASQIGEFWDVQLGGLTVSRDFGPTVFPAYHSCS